MSHNQNRNRYSRHLNIANNDGIQSEISAVQTSHSSNHIASYTGQSSFPSVQVMTYIKLTRIITYFLMSFQSSSLQKPGWQCPQCTYENNMASVACEMCQCSRTTNNMDTDLSQGILKLLYLLKFSFIFIFNVLGYKLKRCHEEQYEYHNSVFFFR